MKQTKKSRKKQISLSKYYEKNAKYDGTNCITNITYYKFHHFSIKITRFLANWRNFLITYKISADQINLILLKISKLVNFMPKFQMFNKKEASIHALDPTRTESILFSPDLFIICSAKVFSEHLQRHRFC